MQKKSKKNLFTIFGSVVLIGSLLATTVVPNFAFGDETEDQLNALNQQQQNLQEQMESTKNELQNTTIEKNEQLKQLNQINNNIESVQNTIDSLESSIAQTESDIAYTEGEIANKQRDYDGRMAIFCNRLKELYQYGEMNYVDVLFQSSDFSDFLTRFEYLSYVAENDKQLLAEVVELRTSLEEQKVSLETQKSSLEAQKKEHEAKVAELELASQEKEAMVAEIAAEESNLTAILDAIEEESDRIAANIAALQSGGGTAPSTLMWPAPASRYITSVYGPRIHPVTKVQNSFHTGIDIGAGNGTNILAAASGTVIVSTYNSAYGNYVVIDHGGGMSTLYAHMSKRLVGVGDTVTVGEVIGLVGSTGLSTGPHLHFEVRINGQHTKPNPYLGI